MNNYAFIDGNNVNLSIKYSGWKLDYAGFRVYLKEKYSVQKAYYFIGYIKENESLYEALTGYGYVLKFKPTIPSDDGSTKGNCDAELVLQAMIDYDNYDKAVIISSDGDFACLVDYLSEKDKLARVLSPHRLNCSVLLRKAAGSNIAFMDDLREKLGR